jgi:hypothetical protein
MHESGGVINCNRIHYISKRHDMGYVSSNMIDMNGPLIQIFLGFLLAIIGCVLMLSASDRYQVSYALFILAGILVALAAVSLSRG